jgi:hypothetical protein
MVATILYFGLPLSLSTDPSWETVPDLTRVLSRPVRVPDRCQEFIDQFSSNSMKYLKRINVYGADSIWRFVSPVTLTKSIHKLATGDIAIFCGMFWQVSVGLTKFIASSRQDLFLPLNDIATSIHFLYLMQEADYRLGSSLLESMLKATRSGFRHLGNPDKPAMRVMEAYLKFSNLLENIEMVVHSRDHQQLGAYMFTAYFNCHVLYRSQVFNKNLTDLIVSTFENLVDKFVRDTMRHKGMYEYITMANDLKNIAWDILSNPGSHIGTGSSKMVRKLEKLNSKLFSGNCCTIL